VTHAGRLFGRSDHVGEQDRGGDDIAFGCLTAPREELLDLVEEGVRLSNEEHGVVPRKLNEFGAGNLVGQVATDTDRDGAVPGSMQDQRGDGDRRKQRPHILQNKRPPHRGNLIDRGAEAFGPCPPRAEGVVAGLARHHDIGRFPGAPHLGHGHSPSFQAFGWQSPWVVVLPHETGEGVDEHQRLDAFGMPSRIADRGRAAQARSDDYGPLTSDRIEHRRDVGIADRFDHTVADVAA
jgi:hypothetical protein